MLKPGFHFSLRVFSKYVWMIMISQATYYSKELVLKEQTTGKMSGNLEPPSRKIAASFHLVQLEFATLH